MSVYKSFENCMQCHFYARNPGCRLGDCMDCSVGTDGVLCNCFGILNGQECHTYVNQNDLCEVCHKHLHKFKPKCRMPSWPECNGRWCDEALKKYREVQYV